MIKNHQFRGFSGPNLEVCVPPSLVSTGEANGIASWISAVTSGLDGLQFVFTAMAVSEEVPSLLDYRARAFLAFGDTEHEVGYGRSNTNRRAEFQFLARRPADLPGPPYRFHLVVEDITSGVRWETAVALPGRDV